ncbi:MULTISPECIES: MGMT family protein [unclassified Pseudonocardia]|uniref:MGMT family protein n=1 Tax=Pseudonocardia sp. P1 TaxID=761194 RepID=UPI00094AD60C
MTTYGSIADLVEGATARSVGHALKTDGHAVPWWRVVTASGRPAPGAERAAYERLLGEEIPCRHGRRRDLLGRRRGCDMAHPEFAIPFCGTERGGSCRGRVGCATSTRTRQTSERHEMIEPRLGGRCTR